MADLTFATPEGQTIDRELLIAYLNTGSKEAPTWSAIGKRVEDSSEEMDWGQESKQDILGNTFTTMKKPVISQTFDPIPLDAGDAAAVKMWNLAVKDHDAQALANQDSSAPTVYLKKADASGKPSLTIYDLVERTETPRTATQEKGVEFVTRKEFDALAALVGELKGKKKRKVEEEEDDE